MSNLAVFCSLLFLKYDPKTGQVTIFSQSQASNISSKTKLSVKVLAALYYLNRLNFIKIINFFIILNHQLDKDSQHSIQKASTLVGLMKHLALNFLLLVSSLIGMYLFMSWTTQAEWNPVINFLYRQNTTASLNQQFQIMVTTGYYLVLMFIVMYLLLEIFKFFKTNKNPETNVETDTIVKTAYESFRNTFYEFVTFLCLYFYFIRNHDDEVTEKQLILIPFWFLSARFFYLLGYLLTTMGQINLKHYGMTLTAFTYIMMLSQSVGYNLFPIL